MQLNRIQKLQSWASTLLWKRSDITTKKELNWRSLKIAAIASVGIFVLLVLILPSEQDVAFSKKIDTSPSDMVSVPRSVTETERSSAQNLWASPRSSSSGTSSQINHDTPMILNSELGNAKTQMRAGRRIPVRILDKFVVSDSSVPVMAEVVTDSFTESGQKIPAGSRLYGEAIFQRGQSRAQIKFTQLSLRSGQMKQMTAAAIGKDGQLGISGNLRSDANKNSAGSVITSFVAGLANGSVETDAFGGSRGGLANGLLSAIGGAARERANQYGEKLKGEREWMEVSDGAECDVILTDTFDFQKQAGF